MSKAWDDARAKSAYCGGVSKADSGVKGQRIWLLKVERTTFIECCRGILAHLSPNGFGVGFSPVPTRPHKPDLHKGPLEQSDFSCLKIQEYSFGYSPNN